MDTSLISSLTLSRALSIAGFDGSGGAGILADVKTFSALGCYGMSVLTAITAQNTQGVKTVIGLEPDFVLEQLNLILDDVGADAIKLGMLHRVEIMEVLVDVLRTQRAVPIVLDPVMIAKNGCPLLDPSAASFLRKALIPLVKIVTPNRYETEVLSGYTVSTPREQVLAAQAIADLGVPVVIVKGGHVDGPLCKDYVHIEGEEGLWLDGLRIDTLNTHGTGCTFSAAITGGLAKGLPVREAVQAAKIYIQGAVEAGARYKIGKGRGPVHHFFNFNVL